MIPAIYEKPSNVTMRIQTHILIEKGVITIYTEHELRELRKAIYEYAADQLMWQVLYINSVAQHAPNVNVIRDKLLSLPRTFELILLNSVNSPAVKDLAQAVYDGNRLFVQYVDCVCNGGTDQTTLKQKLEDSVQQIAKCMNGINPQWGTAEWMTLMHHEIDLMNTVMDKAKQGKYETWAQVLPVVRKIKMDMADYLAHGISGEEQTAQ